MSKHKEEPDEKSETKPEAFHWPFPRFDFGKNSGKVFSGPGATENYRRDKEGDNSSAGRNSAGRSNVGVESSDIVSEPRKRRGRPPKNAGVLDEPGNLQVSQPSEATTVQAAKEVSSETLAPQSQPQNGEQPVKRGRGRPRKIKPLD